jgi:hypothetical protein
VVRGGINHEIITWKMSAGFERRTTSNFELYSLLLCYPFFSFFLRWTSHFCVEILVEERKNVGMVGTSSFVIDHQ